MCILCKDFILDKLKPKELIKAGMEVLSTTEDEEEFNHVKERIEEIHKQVKEEE